MTEEAAIQKRIRINEQIRVPEVRVIGPNAEQLGVVPILRAQELADQSEMDLVEVAPTAKPPVCRIMDFAKYKYEQEKKERKARKNAHVVHLKQIRVKPHIDDHDFETKMKQARSFLESKDKVRINLVFSGREMAFREKAKTILDRFITETADLSAVEKGIMQEGRIMSVQLAPKAEQKA